jgi:RND family efflux transporter MFP subunit
LLAGLIACATASQAQQRPGGAPNPRVPVALPVTQTVDEYVDLTGNAASVNAVKLVARVEGYLESIGFADGARVKKGDVLFGIQQDQYKAQLRQAQAQVMAQQAALDHARTEVGRYTALVKRDAATAVQVDHWKFEQASAEAQLIGAMAQVDIAQLNLSYTTVKAPFDGVMGKHLIDPGNLVGPAGQAAVLAEITQLNPIYVTANLNEQDLANIRRRISNQRLNLAELVKTPIEVGLANESGYPFHGHLEYAAPAIDPTTGTLTLRGILDNPNADLLPGMFVRMRVPMPRPVSGALLVLDRAVNQDQAGLYLLVVNADNVVERRGVTLGEKLGDLRVISAGLKAEDRVVIGDLWQATPGNRVTPQLVRMQTPGDASRP